VFNHGLRVWLIEIYVSYLLTSWSVLTRWSDTHTHRRTVTRQDRGYLRSFFKAQTVAPQNQAPVQRFTQRLYTCKPMKIMVLKTAVP
jgi:hypothetical protein